MHVVRVRALALAVVIGVSAGWPPATAHAAADEPPLVAAARARDAAAVRDLLAAGADVDAESVDGATALHWLVHREMVDQVRDAIERDRRMAAELAASMRDGGDR